MPAKTAPYMYLTTFFKPFALLATNLTFVYYEIIQPQRTVLFGEMDAGARLEASSWDTHPLRCPPLE